MSELPPDEPSIAAAGAARTAELARGGTDPVAERRRAFDRERKRQASAKAPPASVKASTHANDNLIDRTREVWQPRIGRNLTDEDARQISENVTGFFTILAEWSRVAMPTPGNDAGKRVASDNQEVRDDR